MYGARTHEEAWRTTDCLPLRLKVAPTSDTARRLMTWLCERFADQLRSVSKNHVRGAMYLVDAVLHDGGGAGPVYDASAPAAEIRVTLRDITLQTLLSRYRAIYTGKQQRVAFSTFCRHMKWLDHLYVRVIHDGDASVSGIPRVLGTGSQRVTDDTTDDGGGYSTASFGGADDAPRPAAEVRRMVQQIRDEVVEVGSAHKATGAQAFTPKQVHLILDSACTTKERLVVAMLLGQGLRIGGLARMCVDGPVERCNVPRTARTIEKGGRERVVSLNDNCRILLLKWWTTGGRPVSTSSYIFPRAGDPHVPVPTRNLWVTCKGVLSRCNIRGSVAHPHTFRHTLIHMAFHNGSSWDKIAKWIGHSSPNITANAYGNLQQEDIQSSMSEVLEFIPEINTNSKEEWRRLPGLLDHPWPFRREDYENAGIVRRSSGGARKKRKRRRTTTACDLARLVELTQQMVQQYDSVTDETTSE